MKKIIPALLLALALLPAADAAAARQGKVRFDCEDPKTQSELNVCADRKFSAADAELNRAYSQLASRLEERWRAGLKAAEVAWLKYRDANCEYETALYEGGSMRPMLFSLCMERMTRARTAELREQLKDLDN
ncbi:MAG TPA: lysozyme inhibitor LprI family protein [Pyrinomonadaceae bacterium]|jgi:uncharacterized protein YecT (DUF1311 family)